MWTVDDRAQRPACPLPTPWVCCAAIQQRRVYMGRGCPRRRLAQAVSHSVCWLVSAQALPCKVDDGACTPDGDCFCCPNGGGIELHGNSIADCECGFRQTCAPTCTGMTYVLRCRHTHAHTRTHTTHTETFCPMLLISLTVQPKSVHVTTSGPSFSCVVTLPGPLRRATPCSAGAFGLCFVLPCCALPAPVMLRFAVALLFACG